MSVFWKRDFDSLMKQAQEALSSHQPERAGSLAFDAISRDPQGTRKLETLTWDVLDLESTMSPKMILYANVLTLAMPDACVGWIASASSSLQRGDWEAFLRDFASAEKRIYQEKIISWDRYKNGTFHLFFLYEKYWKMRDDHDIDYSIDFRRKWAEVGRVAQYFETLLQRVLEASSHVPVEMDEWKYLAAKGKQYPKAFEKWGDEILARIC